MAQTPIPALEVIWEGAVVSGRMERRNDIRTVATPEGSGDMKPTVVGHTLSLHIYPIEASQQPDTIEINGILYVRA